MAKPNILGKTIISLLSTKHLLSAQDILQVLEKKGTPYNKTSVYRSLEKLQTEGIICKYDFADGEASYELKADHHDHVVCTSCGKIVATDCQLEKSPAVKGFTIDHHHLTLFGVCDTCTSQK